MASVEIRSKAENTSPAGGEWLFTQDPTDPFTVKKMMLNTIRDYISDYIGGFIVGEVKYIDPDITTPDFHVDCDGQVISDADSVYNGKRIFNLNGGDVVLTLTWTADSGGAYADLNLNDIKSINKGDWITGSGIAADSIVKSVNESTGRVIISDVAATGSISSTFTNDGVYVGGGESGSDWDQIQGFNLRIDSDLGTAGILVSNDHSDETAVNGGAYNVASVASTQSPMRTSTFLSDGTNGTPRTGKRTKPHTRFLKAIIRIK